MKMPIDLAPRKDGTTKVDGVIRSREPLLLEGITIGGMGAAATNIMAEMRGD